ncbi:MAG: pentapeptide repeat-containing protein, partial [Ktedonobacterales bacterium]|nr:pentapeptide repeat-containing protein [Ktedonobacterales bacterium]
NTRLTGAHLEGATLRAARMRDVNLTRAALQEADLREAHLEGADLRDATLTSAQLANAHLEGADLYGADLNKAFLSGAFLHDTQLVSATLRDATLQKIQAVGANFREADLTGADLRGSDLTTADFSAAQLEDAILSEAQLDGADCHEANLRRAKCAGARMGGCRLDKARLEGASLQGATLGRADLRRAVLDAETDLTETRMHDDQGIGPWLADVRWGGVNLAVVRWKTLKMLADEECTSVPTYEGAPKERARWLDELECAMRANRQLALALQQEGMEEEAVSFTGHTQDLQRTLYWRRGEYTQYCSSLFLDTMARWLAGYGYRPLRSVTIYILAVLGFAALYFGIGQLTTPHLSVLASLIFSLTSFHGRGFFPAPERANLDSPLVVVAAVEAVVGLIVEITFIAVFTKRFFFGR